MRQVQGGATGDHPLPFGKVPFQHIHVDPIGLVFGMQEFLDRRFVSLSGPRLQPQGAPKPARRIR